MNTPKDRNEKKAKREISAGFIVYRRTREGLKFLVLYHGHHYWNFPKGKIESEEKSVQAAFRETREETGLTTEDLRMQDNFKVHEKFFFKRNGQPTFKIVIFYLAETRNPQVRISREHQGYGWFSYSEAMRIMSRYRGNQKVLKQAYDFLNLKLKGQNAK